MKCDKCGGEIVISVKRPGAPRLMVQMTTQIVCPHCGVVSDTELPFGSTVEKEKPVNSSTNVCG